MILLFLSMFQYTEVGLQLRLASNIIGVGDGGDGRGPGENKCIVKLAATWSDKADSAMPATAGPGGGESRGWTAKRSKAVRWMMRHFLLAQASTLIPLHASHLLAPTLEVSRRSVHIISTLLHKIYKIGKNIQQRTLIPLMPRSISTAKRVFI